MKKERVTKNFFFARMTFCDEVCYRNWEKAYILSLLTVEFIGWPPDYKRSDKRKRRKEWTFVNFFQQRQFFS